MAKDYKDLVFGLDIGTAKVMVVAAEVLPDGGLRVAGVDAGDQGHGQGRAQRAFAVAPGFLGILARGQGCGFKEVGQVRSGTAAHHRQPPRHQPGMVGRAQGSGGHALQRGIVRRGFRQVLGACGIAAQQVLQVGVAVGPGVGG